MPKQHITFLCLFLILFLFTMHAEVLAQPNQSSDAELYIKLLEEIRKLDTKISQLETKMTEKISQLETKMTRNMSQLETNLQTHVDKKFSELNNEVTEVKSDVSYINGQLSIIKWVVTIVGAPILVAMVINFFQDRRTKAKVTTVNQGTEDDAQGGTTPSQVGEVS